MQHSHSLAPTTSTSTGTDAAAATDDAEAATSNGDAATAQPGTASSKPRAGRRGMHSAAGAYWNNERDGVWSFKYEGAERKGMDVVVSVMWIGI